MFGIENLIRRYCEAAEEIKEALMVHEIIAKTLKDDNTFARESGRPLVESPLRKIGGYELEFFNLENQVRIPDLHKAKILWPPHSSEANVAREILQRTDEA